MDVCPHCRRRLLSHISTRCNWCGVEIEDPSYLAQAEVERAASRAEDALHSLQSLTISPITESYSRFGQVGVLLGLPPLSRQDDAATLAQRAEYEVWEQARQAAVIRAQQQKASEEMPAEDPQSEEPHTEAQGRFGHLEL